MLNRKKAAKYWLMPLFFAATVFGTLGGALYYDITREKKDTENLTKAITIVDKNYGNKNGILENKELLILLKKFDYKDTLFYMPYNIEVKRVEKVEVKQRTIFGRVWQDIYLPRNKLEKFVAEHWKH